MTGHVRGDVRKGMHEHQGDPCWDAHCAPHLTHHDAAVRELIARAEARGAERVAQAVEKALGKSEALTQDAMGHRSEHWRGQDYADGLDAGIELTAALVREAIR